MNILPINFLPWRVELRQRKKRQFFMLIGIVVIVYVVMNYALYYHYSEQIKHQKRTLADLQMEMELLRHDQREISLLQEGKNQIISEQQQAERMIERGFLSEYLFHVLPKIVPEGVALHQLEQHGNKVTLAGESEQVWTLSVMAGDLENHPNIVGFEMHNIGTTHHEPFYLDFSLSFGLVLPLDFPRWTQSEEKATQAHLLGGVAVEY